VILNRRVFTLSPEQRSIEIAVVLSSLHNEVLAPSKGMIVVRRACSNGKDEPGSAFADEVESSTFGQLAGVVGVHLAQKFDGIEDWLCCWSRMQGKRAQQLRRVPSNSPRLPVEEVELFRLSELLAPVRLAAKSSQETMLSIAAKESIAFAWLTLTILAAVLEFQKHWSALIL